MTLADIQIDLDSRGLHLVRTSRGTLQVLGDGELTPQLVAALRQYRGVLLRMVPPVPVHPSEGYGWHLGADGERLPGLADWHADVLGLGEEHEHGESR